MKTSSTLKGHQGLGVIFSCGPYRSWRFGLNWWSQCKKNVLRSWYVRVNHLLYRDCYDVGGPDPLTRPCPLAEEGARRPPPQQKDFRQRWVKNDKRWVPGGGTIYMYWYIYIYICMYTYIYIYGICMYIYMWLYTCSVCACKKSKTCMYFIYFCWYKCIFSSF